MYFPKSPIPGILTNSKMFSDWYFCYVGSKVQLEILIHYPNTTNYSQDTILSNISMVNEIMLWNWIPQKGDVYIVLHEYELGCWFEKQTIVE